MKRRPTQSDVAKLAGVSRATVSYVINGLVDNGKQSVTDETRKRVEAAINNLGYSPNAMARSLGSGVSKTIGLLIPDTHNPHYWNIIEGVDEIITQHQYSLLLTSIRLDIERERHGMQMLLQQKVDGLIVTPIFADNTDMIVKHVTTTNPPIVTLGTTITNIDSVLINWQFGAKALMNHLIELGHRNIVFIYGVAEEAIGMNRLSIFQQTLQESSGYLTDKHIVRCHPDIHSAYSAAKQVLRRKNPPTAIIAVNDLLAVGVFRACSEAGLHVPDDVSIAGFDNITLGQYLPVALTTVNIQARKIGRHAAELLLARLKNPELPQQYRKVESKLIVRETTGLTKAR